MSGWENSYVLPGISFFLTSKMRLARDSSWTHLIFWLIVTPRINARSLKRNKYES